MSAAAVNVVEVIERYAAGYFPMVDERGLFFWDRWAVRAVMPVDEEMAGRARRMLRRAQRETLPQRHRGTEAALRNSSGVGRFEIRYLTAVEQVVGQLRHVKENSWVQQDVVEIYRALHAAGLLWTVEAWETHSLTQSDDAKESDGQADHGGRLVGALLGLRLPGVFIAETMYGMVPEASKVCLCQLVLDCLHGGAPGFGTCEMIDVQTPHDRDAWGELIQGTAHPCMRLGERHMALETFLASLRGAWSRHFAGGIKEWIALAHHERERHITRDETSSGI